MSIEFYGKIGIYQNISDRKGEKKSEYCVIRTRNSTKCR